MDVSRSRTGAAASRHCPVRQQVFEQIFTGSLDDVVDFLEAAIAPVVWIGNTRAATIRIPFPKKVDPRMDLRFSRKSTNPPQIVSIHPDNVIERLQIFLEESSTFADQCDAARASGRRASCIRRVAVVVSGRSGRVDFEEVLDAVTNRQVTKDSFSEGRATDVPEADEKDSDWSALHTNGEWSSGRSTVTKRTKRSRPAGEGTAGGQGPGAD